MRKPRLGVFKFTSCDGCQLTLLDCEDALLAVASAVEIAYFPEALTAPDTGRYDLALVEGSVSTEDEALAIHAIRARADRLVAIGACATAGGIQALRNGGRQPAFAAQVYSRPDSVAALQDATPIADHVTVDFELRGCPIDKKQLLEVIAATLAGRRPETPDHAVCLDCKMAGHVCVMVAKGQPCLGPVTHTGCGALCPGYARGCYGCFGPKEGANPPALSAKMAASGATRGEIARLYATFTNNAAPFRDEARAHATADDRS